MSHFSTNMYYLFYGLDSGGRGLPLSCSPSQGKRDNTSKETLPCDECEDGNEPEDLTGGNKGAWET